MKKQIIRRSVDNAYEFANLPPLLARIYNHRNINSLTELEKGLENLCPYDSLLNIEAAVNCLEQVIKNQQRIIIIGDFDADGATSTAVAVSALRAMGAKHVSYLVPNRFEYGYGLTPEIVDVAARDKAELIITVDNGISSISGVAHAKSLGIKVLITDHHLPGEELPTADAIVNPNQPGDLFPCKHLAGVGVVFYVMLALRVRLRENNWFTQQNIAEPNMAQFLDLVALGTVADVVMLDKTNRILIHQGLQRIRRGKACIGIKALLAIAGRKEISLQAADLGFAIAPRLNAAGRLEDMSLGIACLLATDTNQANAIAVQLDTLNRERQAIEEGMQQQALTALKELRLIQDLPLGICLFDEKWHQGVVGIVASRIKDQLHRPVIAFARINENELKGSARSVAGVHMRDVLANIATRHPNLLLKFGGHAMAAGVHVLWKNYPEFCQQFDKEVSQHLNPEDLYGKIYSDGELTEQDFCPEVAEMLHNAGPWGHGFPEPMFDGIFHILEQRLIAERHLKMQLRFNNSGKRLIHAIAFNVDIKAWPNLRCEKILAAYRLDINEYRGIKNLQLIVEHLEPIN